MFVTGAKADRPVTLHKKLQITENKTTPIRYLNSNTWMIFLYSKFSPTSSLNIKSSKLAAIRSEMAGRLCGPKHLRKINEQNKKTKTKVPSAETLKISQKNPLFTFFENPEKLATQDPHSHMATICYGWAGAASL